MVILDSMIACYHLVTILMSTQQCEDKMYKTMNLLVYETWPITLWGKHYLRV
jgi:hypothetical protein